MNGQTGNVFRLQIETPEAVENVEEIAAVPGVDLAICFGPGDLGLRYHLAGDTDGAMLEAAIVRSGCSGQSEWDRWGCWPEWRRI